MDSAATCKSRDLLSSPRLALLVFWLPAIAIVVAGTPACNNNERTIVWTAALSTMGVACIVNVFRCGRVHCYLSGPFFLLMALATLSYGLGLLPLPRNGWNLIGFTTLVGAVASCCLPEMLFGKYRDHRAGDGNQ